MEANRINENSYQNENPPVGCKVAAVILGLFFVLIFGLGIIKFFELIIRLCNYFGTNPLSLNL